MKAIEMKKITKKFDDFTAIDNVSFSVNKGEIHSICGENGAGKSTLMNILFGLLDPTEGDILINGEKIRFSSPKDAINFGIGMVHQHFKLVPSLKVYENVLLGKEKTKPLGKINDKIEIKEVQQTIDRFGFKLDADAKVSDLSLGVQQTIEIIKMLHRNVDILILDEPTAVLTPRETTELLKKLIELKKQGKTIVLITHKLEEIKKCSDKITIIRKGKLVKTVNTSEVTQEEISRLMVGHDVTPIMNKTEIIENSTKLLSINNLECILYGRKLLKNINMVVQAGEVVGIAGIDGNGQSELVDILTGMNKKYTGSIEFKGKSINKTTPKNLRKIGFGLVPEDRYKSGLNSEMSLWKNIIAGRLNRDGVTKNGFLIRERIKEKVHTLVEEYDIRNADNINKNVSTLSGGNAQKIIMARELSCDPEVVILSQPTRGIDVGSIEYIHSKILELKKQQKAILLISSEITEILNLSDRIYVMYEGRISGERKRNETNKEDIGALMVGINKKQKKGELAS